jgi:endoglucanase
MLAGHCDQIGFMVRYIDKEGYIWVSALGGIDAGVVPGAHATVHTKNGPITGVFGRKPIHFQTNEERSKMTLELKKMWLDIGAKSKAEVEEIIQIGDPVTFSLGATELRNGIIAGAGIDNRVGLFVAIEVARLCSQKKISVALYAVSTVQEEVGLRGAHTASYAVDPEVGIAIDVVHATDNPGSDDTKASSCKLGAGPSIVRGPNANPVVEKLLLDSAKRSRIPVQINPDSRPLGNDANAMQITRGGVATGAVQIPNRYMHTQVELCSIKDLDNAIKLLTGFISRITAATQFIPE